MLLDCITMSSDTRKVSRTRNESYEEIYYETCIICESFIVDVIVVEYQELYLSNMYNWTYHYYSNSFTILIKRDLVYSYFPQSFSIEVHLTSTNLFVNNSKTEHGP